MIFQKAKNIDTSFRHIKIFSIIFLLCCASITIVVLIYAFNSSKKAQERIYVITNGKAIEAFATERKENIPVEAKDHVKTFHQYFFDLEPDDKLIKQSIGRSLYLADQSAKREYDNLKERNYYTTLITSNISQRIRVDSVELSTDTYPYAFRCTATIEITRTTSVVERLLITKGFLRSIKRSENNPHGFLIEQWSVIEDRDITVKAR